MKCCTNCIGDRGLHQTVFLRLSVELGSCSFCLSQNIHILDPTELAEYLDSLISIYELNSNGKSLVQCLKDDWGMFDHERMDEARARNLLSEILDDGEIVRRRFAPLPAYETDTLKRWEKLRDELMFGNRFFPDALLNSDQLKKWLPQLEKTDEFPSTWYRARILSHEEPYSLDQMGAPPKWLATHGRANPAGIPYLYLASTESTAVAEIRPHTGDNVCIARFNIQDGLKIIDLRNPRKSVSPFFLKDEQEMGFLRGDIGFLERLGEELTRPVLPRVAAIDYVPTQYLCEFIKKQGYDGVMYSSSVGDGMNLALFDPLHATARDVTQRFIARVLVEIN